MGDAVLQKEIFSSVLYQESRLAQNIESFYLKCKCLDKVFLFFWPPVSGAPRACFPRLDKYEHMFAQRPASIPNWTRSPSGWSPIPLGDFLKPDATCDWGLTFRRSLRYGCGLVLFRRLGLMPSIKSQAVVVGELCQSRLVKSNTRF